MFYHWHVLNSKQVLEIFRVDPNQGLSQEQIVTQRQKFGLNQLPAKQPFSAFGLFLEQFKGPLVLILIGASLISVFLKEHANVLIIWAAICLNVIVGFFQEKKANRALDKLRKIVKHQAWVLREGTLRVIDSGELVPGDIIVLKPGNQVPADGRLLESFNLKINEAALTGEWLAAQKQSQPLEENTPLADRDNMVYMSTIVEDGEARAVITQTGLRTEVGQIAATIEQTKEGKTPLQKKLNHFNKIIGIAIFFICGFIFIEGALTGGDLSEMLTTAIAVAVAAIPESLPVAMTVILAIGMERILKRRGLVRKLLAAETLGSTSVICTDKTLTLTKGEMEVIETYTPGQKIAADDKYDWAQNFKQKADFSQQFLMTIVSLNNEALVKNPQGSYPLWQLIGRPTDRALVLAGAKVGKEKPRLEKENPVLWEIPFNSEQKFIASLRKTASGEILYLSGAPEKVFDLSKKVLAEKEEKRFDEKTKQQLIGQLQRMASQGQRVIGIAYKKESGLKPEAADLNDLVFVGFIGLKDPLRPEAKQTIKICQQAGLKPIIVTGDHLLTARAIAQELGLTTKQENILEGRQLELMTDKELNNRLSQIEVYARVEPKHKMRIIQAWQARGRVVAMTGDGINDAPALKKADIGIALGSGTDIAKDVSDLVLLDNNFSVILAAIEEGRAIIDNMRKVITYLLSDALAEVILIAGALITGLPLPVLPGQILWVNLIEDSLPATALTFEPKEKDLMSRRPEKKNVPILNQEMKVLIFIISFVDDFLLLGLFFWLLKQGWPLDHIRTMIFAALAIDTVFAALCCKSLRRNLWQINPFDNKLLIVATVFGVLALMAGIYLPPLQQLLKTVPLGPPEWGLVLSIGISELILIEITKYWFIIKNKT